MLHAWATPSTTTFNRTIEELKPGFYADDGLQGSTFNRTIEELKRGGALVRYVEGSLLIAP